MPGRCCVCTKWQQVTAAAAAASATAASAAIWQETPLHLGPAGADACSNPDVAFRTGPRLPLCGSAHPKARLRGFKEVEGALKNYGPVVRVWISHTGQHGELHSSQVRRRRPCNLGFVHMETHAAVLRVLAEGEEQQVDGILIQVQRFQRQIGDSMVQFQLSEVDEETEFKDQVDGNTPDSESTEKVDRRRNAKIELYKHIGSCAVPIVNKLMQEVEGKSPDSEVPEKADYKTPDSDSTEKVDWKRPDSEANEKAECKTPDSEATEKDCDECCRQHFSPARHVYPQASEVDYAK